ncbi:hypothetical protein VMC_19690 [Vibrio alginolyticus 40B]|nr:hypothetical protein VMC_19690 [Vibrio alginolyticus 40B]
MGTVEIYRRKGELYNRIDAGGLFGQMGLLMNNRVRMPAKAIEDTLVYCIPENIFNELCDEFENFADYMELEDSARFEAQYLADLKAMTLPPLRHVKS